MSTDSNSPADPNGPTRVARRPVSQVEAAPKRKDPEDTDLLQAPETDLIRNKDPLYRYEWKRRESLPKFLRPQTVGAQGIGFKTCPSWEIVEDDQIHLKGRSRADQGSPVDSALQHGQMIAIRVLEADYERTYGWFRAAQSDAREARLRKGEKQSFNGKASVQAATGEGSALPSFLQR